MITKLVLFGASGDLAGRYLLPALAAVGAAGELPPDFTVIGAAREDWDDDAFARVAAEQLRQHAAWMPAADRERVVRSLHYRRVDVTESRDVAGAVGAASESAGPGPVAIYLALPPAVFPSAITALARAELPAGSRIAIEKPFGEDLSGAIALNGLLLRLFGDATEDVIFRVDHALGMTTSQNLLGLRTANRVLEPLWNSDHIEEIDVLWEETLALEGRAGYYDGAGALKDVLQNHMLQVLCLTAMEPPTDPEGSDLHDRKLDVLRSVRPISAADAATTTQRARYTSGRLAPDAGGAGRAVPAYAEEDGVDPGRKTETFVEMLLELDSPRWTGTRFRLRAGKALAERRKGLVVRFRPARHVPFGQPLENIEPNELRIGIDGPTELALHLTGSARRAGSAGSQLRPSPLTLTGPPPATELPAYANVLLNVLEGRSGLAVRGDEAEEAWRVVSPVLEAWADGRVPLAEYPAGSTGPPPLPSAPG